MGGQLGLAGTFALPRLWRGAGSSRVAQGSEGRWRGITVDKMSQFLPHADRRRGANSAPAPEIVKTGGEL